MVLLSDIDAKKQLRYQLQNMLNGLFRFVYKITKHAKLLVSLQSKISPNSEFVSRFVFRKIRNETSFSGNPIHTIGTSFYKV
jgi:hypothetical protein